MENLALNTNADVPALDKVRFKNLTPSIENTLKLANNSKSFTDVIFSCENGRVEVPSHKSILSSASPFLSRMFEENPTSSVLIIPDVPAKIVRAAVKLIYTGEVNLKKRDIIAVMALCVDLGIMPFETSLSINEERLGDQIRETKEKVDEAVKNVINLENLQFNRTTQSHVKENVGKEPGKNIPKKPQTNSTVKAPNSKIITQKRPSKDNTGNPAVKKLKKTTNEVSKPKLIITPRGKLSIQIQPNANENPDPITVEIEEMKDGENSEEIEEDVEVTQIVEFEVRSEVISPKTKKIEEANREPTAEEIVEATRQSSQKDHAYAFYNAKGSKMKNKLRGEAIALDERKRSDHNYFATNI